MMESETRTQVILGGRVILWWRRGAIVALRVGAKPCRRGGIWNVFRGTCPRRQQVDLVSFGNSNQESKLKISSSIQISVPSELLVHRPNQVAHRLVVD